MMQSLISQSFKLVVSEYLKNEIPTKYTNVIPVKDPLKVKSKTHNNLQEL